MGLRECTLGSSVLTLGEAGELFSHIIPSYGQHWENGPLAVEAKLLAISYRGLQQIGGGVAGKVHKGTYGHQL